MRQFLIVKNRLMQFFYALSAYVTRLFLQKHLKIWQLKA